MSQEFVPGRELNAGFYDEVVEPLVRGYRHAAALLGWGSDVLGDDTTRSMDHGWGPRLQLFVRRSDIDDVRRAVDEGLPEIYSGLPVRFGWDDKPVRHWVDVTTLDDWLKGQLGLDPRRVMSAADWLSVPQQLILGVVAGAVYADPYGELREVREALAWYPHDVWLWLLASQWRRIGQEEAFTGRTAEVGDELGSRLIAARQAHELMRLAFLQARTYRPYSKWFGTAFARLPGASELTPALEAAVAATDFPSREAALVRAYEILARRHNEAGITAELEPTVRGFHGRPFRVLFADRFAAACQEAITDEWLRELPLVGAVDQFVDSTDVLSVPARPQQLRGLHTVASATGRKPSTTRGGTPPGRIVLVSGPPGAGKSTVAVRLAAMAEAPTVHVPTDSFYNWICEGYIPPYLPESEQQNGVVLSVMIEAACAYSVGGYEVILDGVIGRWMLDPFGAVCRDRGLALSYVVLRPSLDITLTRAVTRKGEGELREADPITALHGAFSDLGELERHVIDSSGQSADETAVAIKDGLTAGRFAMAGHPRTRSARRGSS